MMAVSNRLFALLLLLAAAWPANANTCLMLYQLADNNLDFYIRQDFEELGQSSIIKNPMLNAWVYHDALSGAAALPGVVQATGDPVTAGYAGSRILHWDHTLQKMVVEEELPGEQNSDTIDSIQSFFERVMADCVSTGHLSFMAVFASHGGGFNGFGGDENKGRKQRLRFLQTPLQPNQDIATAISDALANTAGAPERLQVLGFDACNMAALESADDYRGVAEYLLGSEALEPGHGWAYAHLTVADDALSLARDVVDTFIGQTQGGTSHATPKTLAIIDLDLFSEFLTALEAFSAELLKVINTDGDATAFTLLARARSSSVAFQGVVDGVGSREPSALDIGDFLAQYKTMCNPGGDLGTALDALIVAYNAMFVHRGVGVGTPTGTGMHATFPTQNEFKVNSGIWPVVLFGQNDFRTDAAPNYLSFLEFFLKAETPTVTSDSTICGQGIALPPDLGTVATDTLLIEPKLNEVNGKAMLETVMTEAVDEVSVQYSAQLTTALKGEMDKQGYPAEEGDYLFLNGGTVKGTFTGSKFTAEWNRDFYFLDVFGKGSYDALYVFDQGNDARSTPCLYFPESSRQAVIVNKEIGWLEYLFFNETKFLELGATYCMMSFSVNATSGEPLDNLVLFTTDGGTGAFAEKRREEKGFIYPIVWVDAVAKGYSLDKLPGGFYQTHVDWNETLDYRVINRRPEAIFEYVTNADAVVVSMTALDNDPNAPISNESHYFDIIRKNRLNDALIEPSGESSGTSSTSESPSTPSTDSSGSPNVDTSSSSNGDASGSFIGLVVGSLASFATFFCL